MNNNRSIQQLCTTVFGIFPSLLLGLSLLIGLMYTFAVFESDISINPLLLILGFLLVEVIFISLYKFLSKQNKHTLSKVLLYCCLIIGLIFTSSQFQTFFSEDWRIVDRCAEAISKNLQPTNSIYFSYYPFQRTWTVVLSLLYKISTVLFRNYHFLSYFLNAALTVATLYLIQKTLEKISNCSTAIIGMALYVFNPITYIYATNTYNDVITAFFCLLVLYIATFDRKKSAVLLGVISALAFLIKATSFISLIAVFLYWILAKKENRKIKIGITALTFVATYFCLYLIVSTINWNLNQQKELTLFFQLLLGLSFPNGYWNQELFLKMTEFNDKKSRLNFVFSSLSESFKTHSFFDFIDLWLTKQVALLSSGMSMSEHFKLSNNNYNLLWDYLLGSKRILTIFLAQILRMVTLFNTLVNAIFFAKKRFKIDSHYPFFCFLFGYILFHCFWEVQPRYIYPALPVFIILSAISVSYIFETIAKSNKAKLLVNKAHAISFVLLLVIMIISFYPLALKGRNFERVTTGVTDNNYENKFTEVEDITQSFVSNKSFNQIEMDAIYQGDSNSYLSFTLYDNENKIIFTKEIDPTEIIDGHLSISFISEVPGSKDEYTFELCNNDTSNGTLYIKPNDYEIFGDIYPWGQSNIVPNYDDINFVVVNRHDDTYIKPSILITIELIIVTTILVGTIINMKSKRD